MSAPFEFWTQAETDERIRAHSAKLLSSALRYAEHGYPVFPCRPDKKPYTTHGFHDASREPDQIRTWWTSTPLAMIGIPTGWVSGLLVLDIDKKKGKDGFATLKAAGYDIPDDAPRVRTPSGGMHVYFRMPPDIDIRSAPHKVGPGVDVRANGGYVIAPPSRSFIHTEDYQFLEGYEREMGRLI